MSDIILFIVLMFGFLIGFFSGEIFNHNKVLHPTETPKVGKHEESGKFVCDKHKSHLTPKIEKGKCVICGCDLNKL